MGVAVLASVFSHSGGYGSPEAFVHGFTPAVWAAVALSAAGILAALLTAGRTSEAPLLPKGVALVAEPEPSV
jgi:hypothetical protein